MHCPSCGEEVDDESAFCRFCGADLDPETTAERSSPPQNDTASENDSSGLLSQIGYWGGRISQVGAVGFAGILLLGGVLGNMNVLSFAVLGIVALVLFAVVGVVELLVIRPLS